MFFYPWTTYENNSRVFRHDDFVGVLSMTAGIFNDFSIFLFTLYISYHILFIISFFSQVEIYTRLAISWVLSKLGCRLLFGVTVESSLTVIISNSKLLVLGHLLT